VEFGNVVILLVLYHMSHETLKPYRKKVMSTNRLCGGCVYEL
jgi:hypothetical protein